MFTDKDVPGILYFISLIKKYNIVYSKKEWQERSSQS